jgi:protein arginine kinase activator
MSASPFPVCTHCGFTWDEYRARGLLGCPQCYAVFGDALQADIAWFHRALAHSTDPADSAAAASASAPERAALREQLSSALRKEHYEEAARLRRLLDGLG